eukprot:409629-Amphidinium_carterae.1
MFWPCGSGLDWQVCAVRAALDVIGLATSIALVLSVAAWTLRWLQHYCTRLLLALVFQRCNESVKDPAAIQS